MSDRFERIQEFARLAGEAIGRPITRITVTPIEIEDKHGLKLVATDESSSLVVSFGTVTRTGTVSAGITPPIPRELGSAGFKVADIVEDIGGDHPGTRLEFCPEKREERKVGEILIRRSHWDAFSFDPELPKILYYETSFDPGKQEKSRVSSTTA